MTPATTTQICIALVNRARELEAAGDIENALFLWQMRDCVDPRVHMPISPGPKGPDNLKGPSVALPILDGPKLARVIWFSGKR